MSRMYKKTQDLLTYLMNFLYDFTNKLVSHDWNDGGPEGVDKFRVFLELRAFVPIGHPESS